MGVREILDVSRELADSVEALSFDSPVTHVYNPLRYAWQSYETYLRRFATGTKRAVFMGINPGPWGMTQTGIPFGEIDSVRTWMGIEEPVGRPENEHPKRPVEGFRCGKSEVSGRRLWGLMKDRFTDAETFFEDHFVANYCPLVFLEESGRNRTPDKLPAGERNPLFKLCDDAVREVIRELSPAFVVGIGKFAESRLRDITAGMNVTVSTILHPSPANPRANRDWAGEATRALEAAGIW
jgi:single-strand selective monofunctional uracil DNA glycosylase